MREITDSKMDAARRGRKGAFRMQFSIAFQAGRSAGKAGSQSVIEDGAPIFEAGKRHRHFTLRVR